MVQSPPSQNVAVVLRIGEGSFTEGFAVELQIIEDGHLIDEDSDFPRLAAAPEIPQCYQVWKLTYDALGREIGSRAIQPVSAQVTHESSLETCLGMTKEFETKVKTWLRGLTFRMLRDRIQANVRVAADQSVPIILDCDTGDLEQDILLRKLPWHTWEFDRLKHAEVVLSTRFAYPTLPLQAPVRTLAIFGSDEGGLNLQDDIKALKELERDGSKIDIRLQPDREQLSNCLNDQPWDILFFAGHSFSDAGCQSGAIQLQNGVPLAIDDLREDLKQAICNDLKLVIFNSCDGLGIARYIEQLSVSARLKMPVMIRPLAKVPFALLREKVKGQRVKESFFPFPLSLSPFPYFCKKSIVMREPVPDRVARKFLQYFLEEFSQGKPLYLAVRKARNRLHWMESDNKQPCPAATWLPIVCQNPNQLELVFPQLQPEPITSELQPDESQPKLESKTDQLPQLHPPRHLKLWRIIGLVALAFTLVIVLPSLGKLIRDSSATPRGVPPKPTPPSPQTYKTLADVPVPDGAFRYGGSTTWAPIRGSVDREIQEAKLNFRWHYVNPPQGNIPSTGIGVEMLLNGEIDFAQASRLLNVEDIKNAQKNGIRLKAIAVAKSFKAIAVHPSLTLKNKGLTVHQIKGICDGKITNWKEVGGPDLPIQTFTRRTPDLIKTLGDGCKGKNAIFLSTPQQVIQKLAETPGGFNVNTAPLLVPQCSIKTLPMQNESGKFVTPYKEPLVSPSECRVQPNQVNVEVFKSGEYPKELSDTLYIFVKEDGQIGQQAGEAYANLLRSNEGQKLLEAAGFVSIRQTIR